MSRKPSQFDLFGERSEPAPRRAEPKVAVLEVVTEIVKQVVTEVLPDERPVAPQAAAVLSVSELTFELKGAVEPKFAKVAVLGEVSNCRRQASGHIYFTLKDDTACVAAVMWRREAMRLPFEVRDGLQLVCQGRVEIYGPHGKYQLIVDRLEPVGAGALALAFAELKRKLEGEGLFDPARKRRLPFLPRRIGVVTSPTGAALRDFLRVLHLRHPGLPVLIAPARVQGAGAARDLVVALGQLARRVDVIVLTRGGGSMEDLWAFNDEALARAIAASPVPVMSAIGHEIDFTIADFVADKRAPTPTGAAEMLAPVRQDLRAALAISSQRLSRGLTASVQGQRQRVLKLRMRLGDPRRAITERRLGLADLTDRLQLGMAQALTQNRQRLRQLGEQLQRRNPRETMAQRLRELHALRVALERAGAKAVALETRSGELHRLSGRLERGIGSDLRTGRERLGLARARLEATSPQRVFERGYSLTRKGGHVVGASAAVKGGDRIEVTLGMREQDGELVEDRIHATVE